MVLTAMGRDTATARSAIRYTLGRHTRINDINSAIKATVSAVKALTQQK
jgi:cysteine sulfinate desulfinase/cysteine desulfurase-like protein